MNSLARYINERIDGNIYDRPSVLAAYSTDRSLLKITPRLVAVPISVGDIRQIVKISGELAEKGHSMPLTVRGSGLDCTGADLSTGCVISLEKMNNILEVDEEARLARVQAGVTLGKLKAVVAAYGLTLPIDADPEETLSDIISNCVIDRISSKYKGIFYYVEHLEVVLSDGSLYQTSSLNRRSIERVASQTNFIGKISSTVLDALDKNFDIVAEMKKSPHDLSGYKTLSKIENDRHNYDLMPLFFGAQHTLGIITEVIVRLEPIRRESQQLLMTFNSADAVTPFLKALKKEEPASIELFSSDIVHSAAAQGKKLQILPLIDKGYYLTAGFDDVKFVARQKIKHCSENAPSAQEIILEDPSNTKEFDRLGRIVSQFLNDNDISDRPAIFNDVYIPEDSLADFLSDLSVLERTYDRPMPVIGSAANSIYSVLPEFDVADVIERRKLLEFMQSFVTAVRNNQGLLAGGSAEGCIKGAFTNALMDPRERTLCTKLKQNFDPHLILNPAAKIGARFPYIAKHIRSEKESGILAPPMI